MMLAIKSCHKHEARRAAVRDTWLSRWPYEFFFLVGKPFVPLPDTPPLIHLPSFPILPQSCCRVFEVIRAKSQVSSVQSQRVDLRKRAPAWFRFFLRPDASYLRPSVGSTETDFTLVEVPGDSHPPWIHEHLN